jgi:pyridoxal phosphate phosphatase PHOSPHO2
MTPFIHQVICNESRIQDERLHIAPFHSLADAPHTCKWCPPNLCKGSVLDALLNKNGTDTSTFSRVLYAGDGAGDFCPALSLRETDVLLMRYCQELTKAQGLWKRHNKHEGMVKAQVCLWDWGETLLEHVKEALLVQAP